MIPQRGGLPHSDIHGSTPARGSPWLFAACHVFHRLLVPRHPPNALLLLEITEPPSLAIQTIMYRNHPHQAYARSDNPHTRYSNSACTHGHAGHHNQHIRKTSLIDIPPIARLYPTRCCHPARPWPVRLRDPPCPQNGRGAVGTRSHGSSTKRRVQRRTRT